MDDNLSHDNGTSETLTLDTGQSHSGNAAEDPQNVDGLNDLVSPKEDGEENVANSDSMLQSPTWESGFSKAESSVDEGGVSETTVPAAQYSADSECDDSVLHQPLDKHFKDMPKHHGPFKIIVRHKDERILAETKIACFFNLAGARIYPCIVALTVFHLLTDQLFPVVYQKMCQNKNVKDLPPHLTPPKHILCALESILAREHLKPYLFGQGLTISEIRSSVNWYIAILNKLLVDGILNCSIQQDNGRTNTFKLKGLSFRYALPYSDSKMNFDAVLIEVCKLNRGQLDDDEIDALKYEACGTDVFMVVDSENFSHDKASSHSDIHPEQLENRWCIKGNAANPVDLQKSIPELRCLPMYFLVPGDCSRIMQFVFKHGSSLTNDGDSGRGIFVHRKSGSKCFNIVAMMTHTCNYTREYSYCQSVQVIMEQFQTQEEITLDIIGKARVPTENFDSLQSFSEFVSSESGNN